MAEFYVGKKRLREIAQEAAKAFWEKVAQEIPQGNPDKDLDVGTIIGLEFQMQAAIERYVESIQTRLEDEEVPPPPPGVRGRGRSFGD